MSDLPTNRPTLLADLENRQEEVIRRLDDLNRRIESVVSQERVPQDRTPLDAGLLTRPLGLSQRGDH